MNHITFAVTDVARSVAFYRDLLGFDLRAIWDDGAYLDAGVLWLCLSRDDNARSAPHPDYTHVAFSIADADYPSFAARIRTDCAIWKQDASEGASTYFLDPDGHRLEIHLGSLETRLAHYRNHPDKSVRIIEG